MAEKRWLAISSLILHVPGNLNSVDRICLVAADVLHAHSASIALVIDHVFDPIASSDSLAQYLDEQQFAIGDGPTFDAQRSDIPVSTHDIFAHHAREKWPAFSAIAHRREIGGIFAFPLRVGHAYIGVLTVYRTKTGDLTAAEFADGLILASIATAELVSHQAGALASDQSDILEPGLYDQSSLQLAAGMVAEAMNCSIVEGLVRIRARAFADELPVTEIARQIVARKLTLEK